ncbi:MAG: hypothetical protein ACI353_03890 [Alloprevotella sp.]
MAVIGCTGLFSYGGKSNNKSFSCKQFATKINIPMEVFSFSSPTASLLPAGRRPPSFEGDTSGPEEKITGPEVFPSGPEVFPIAAEVSRPAAYCRGNGPFRQPAVGFFWKNVPFLFCLSACLA